MGKKGKQLSKNEGFTSIAGFVLTVVGFAIGTGTLWRFPYVCGTEGGAIFILAYIAVILAIGVPLLAAEMTMGYATQTTLVNTYKRLEPRGKWHWAAYINLAAGLAIMGYVPIFAYILDYTYMTATGVFEGLNGAQITEIYQSLGENKLAMFGGAIVNWVIVIVILLGGVEKGVERLNKILLPMLGVIMVICMVVGLQMDGASAGVEFIVKPSLEHFTMNSVMTALGQAFFAIGIGMVASMVFGGYVKKKGVNMAKQSFLVCGSIVLAGVLAGFMIFPMVFGCNLEPAQGMGLSLVTLPTAFASMKGGRIIGTLFYIGFYFAAVTSSSGLIESVASTFSDMLNITKKKAIFLALGCSVVLGSIILLTGGLEGGFFAVVDNITSNYLLVLGGLIISIFVGWIWGIDKFLEAANIRNKAVRIWMTISIKYVSPLVILVLFFTTIF